MTPAGNAAPILRVEGVEVVLGGRRVLDGVSFEVAPGEFTGLIGSNGAGKTTLLRVILGLQHVAAGRVLVEDGEPRCPPPRRHRLRPPEDPLGRGRAPAARDLVALGIDGNRIGLPLPSKRRRAQVDEMLHAVGAEHFAEARVGTLSGGELQRVLIAHALIGRPRLLLLDEPLANLDPASAHDIVVLLHTLTEEHGVAVLLSAHEMNTLIPVMDRIVYLAGGRAASGSVEEVVRPEVLSALYGHPVEVLHVNDRLIVIAGPGHEHEFSASIPVDPSLEQG